MSTFVHLHVHSDFSTLDGMGKVRELIETAKEYGQGAISLTDHGTTSGLWEAQKVGDEIGLKVIHGNEFYYERENDGKNGHLLVLAKSNVGLRNIFKMQEIAHVENFYYKPRINWDILKEHHEGLIVTSACLGSTFNQYLMEGEYQEAKQWARKFHDLFGDDFYIEIQPNDIPEQHITNEGSVRIAKELGIELVATNDVHYTHETDTFPHEVLLAMQVKKKMSDESRFKFPETDFWLRTEEEMYEAFSTHKRLNEADVRRAMKNTVVIADKCEARINKGHFLPQFPDIPEGETPRNVLVGKVMEGARKKELASTKPFMADVQHEIDVIDEEGYSDYFLIVQDYVNYARDNGIIVGDGRGSGSGSKVGYLTDIHQIPPHEFDLLFERFMSHGRTPDIDVDFSDQDFVFDYLAEKYGSESVGRIVTYGRMTPKAVIRKVLNTFEVQAHIIKQITSIIPEATEKTLHELYEDYPALLEWKEKYKTEWEVIERLEGVISHTGVHAGGAVIYPNLSDHLPIISDKDDRSKRVVGFNMDELEELGFFKFDILGLETISDVKRCLDSIEEHTGEKIDLDKIDYEDQSVYKMLQNGDVSGVFQLAEQSGKVMEQAPSNFRDLIAINALIRPGVGDWNEYIARRKGKDWEMYEPRLPYMEETEGTMTYQEQYLLDAHHLAGWGIAYADKHLRKNKDIRNDEALRQKFIEDGIQRGHPQAELEAVWSEIEDAVDGGYGFNKSHSASYARISYQTAYLKYHYPEHFYASLMSGEKTDGDGQDAIAGYIAEMKRRDIPILPPDINNSDENFVVTDEGVNYRITTIRHVGDSAINHIKELRPIASFDDFMERRVKKHAKKNVVINLIKAGAFDFDEPNRAELLWRFDMSERTKTQIKEDYQCPKYEWNDKVRAEWEKEVLGMYLSTHPMERYGFKPLDHYPDNGVCVAGGEIYDMRIFNDKNGKEMAFIFANTLHGNVKFLAFSYLWAREDIRNACQIDNIILVNGRRSGNDVIINDIDVLEGEVVSE